MRVFLENRQDLGNNNTRRLFRFSNAMLAVVTMRELGEKTGSS